MRDSHTRAEEYRTALTEALHATTIPDARKVLITLDPRQVPKSAAAGAILIQPPSITLPDFHRADFEWEFAVIAGPAKSPHTAWQRINVLLRFLHQAELALTRAEPGEFITADNASLPMYVVTIDDPE